MRRYGAARALLLVACLLALTVTPNAAARPPSPALCGFSCAHPWAFNLSLTVTNPQAVSTGAYEQYLVFPSSSYAAYLNANLSNVYVTYGNGTTVPTWVETNNSNASSTTHVWLRLFSIAAGASVTVYLDAVSKGAFLPSVFGPFGWAPTLGATYGAWDDGARVFPFYDNFSGAVLKSSLWSVSAPSGTVGHLGSVAVSNGLTVTLGTCGGYPAPCNGGVVGKVALTPPVILDGLVTAATGAGGFEQAPSTTNTSLGYQYVSYAPSPVAEGAMDSNTYVAATYSGPVLSTTHIAGVAWVTGSTGFAFLDYGATAWSHTALSLPSTVTPYVGLFQYSGSAAHVSMTWVRERAFEGTLPTVAIGVATSLSPTWVGAVWVGTHNVSLTWAPSVASAGVLNYTLRSGPSCGTWNTTSSVGGNNTTFVRHAVYGSVETCFILQAWTATANALSTTLIVVPPTVVVVPPPSIHIVDNDSNVTLHVFPTNVTVPAFPWATLVVTDLLLTLIVGGIIAYGVHRDVRRPPEDEDVEGGIPLYAVVPPRR